MVARTDSAQEVPGAHVAPVQTIDSGGGERGFVLVVDMPVEAATTDVRQIVRELHRRLIELAPAAEVQASLIRSPAGTSAPPVSALRAGLLGSPGPRRRYVYRSGPTPVAPSGVVVDLPRKQLCVEGKLTALTFTEYEILEHLVSHPGEVVERAALLWAIWGPWEADRPNERTIDVHIKRLRAKLDRYGSIIRTVRGSGYRYDPHTDVYVRRHADRSKAPCVR